MQIASGEHSFAGLPVETTPTETNFGPANCPDWANTDWYRTWVELAKQPHGYPHN